MSKPKLFFLLPLLIFVTPIKAQTFLGEGISIYLDSVRVHYFSFKSHINYTKPVYCINDDTSIIAAMPLLSRGFSMTPFRAENSDMPVPPDVDSTLCMVIKDNKHNLKAAFQLTDSVTNKTVSKIDSTDNDMVLKILNKVSSPEESDCFTKNAIIDGYKIKIETDKEPVTFYDITFILDSSGTCGGNSGRVIALTKPTKIVNCLRQF
jgi:hypothetical protein